MIGMPCIHSNIMAATTTVFSGVFQLADFFPAAFRLMLKIFSLAAKFGGLGVGPTPHFLAVGVQMCTDSHFFSAVLL